MKLAIHPMLEKLEETDEKYKLFQQAMNLFIKDKNNPDGLRKMRAAATKGSLDAVAYWVVVDNGCSEVGGLSKVKDTQKRKAIISDLRKLQHFGGQHSYQLGIMLEEEAKSSPDLKLESVRCIADGASSEHPETIDKCCALAVEAVNQFKNAIKKRGEMKNYDYGEFISNNPLLTIREVNALEGVFSGALGNPANKGISSKLKYCQGLLLYSGGQNAAEITEKRKTDGRDLIIEAAEADYVEAYTLAGKILYVERDRRVQGCRFLILAKDDPEAKAFRDEILKKGDEISLREAAEELNESSSGSSTPVATSAPSSTNLSSSPSGNSPHPPPSVIKKNKNDETKKGEK